MKKILILVIVLFLTGCSITYPVLSKRDRKPIPTHHSAKNLPCSEWNQPSVPVKMEPL